MGYGGAGCEREWGVEKEEWDIEKNGSKVWGRKVGAGKRRHR